VYFSAGKYEEARDAALDGLKNGPDNMWLNNSLGVALLNLGDKEGALEAFIIAEKSAEKLTPADWGVSYPGNDPVMYESGLEETKASIHHNLHLLDAAHDNR
jgi:tetratricopeptide (TPR) repeat protein